jgi:hypothetical protein
MKPHTMLVGTSKSKIKEGYYHVSKEKVWGLLARAKVTTTLYGPTDYKILEEKHGIVFYDLIGKIASSDKPLKKDPEAIAVGVKKFLKYLDKNPSIKNVLFNGKTAATWVLNHVHAINENNKKVDHLKRNKGLNWGIQEIKYGKTNFHVMPNTSPIARSHWCAKPWMDFWKSIAKR